MKDIKLGLDGDIELNGSDIRLVDSLAQSIRIKLLWFVGEWEFNPELGMPYYDYIFAQNADMDTVARIFEEDLSEIEGVSSVKSVSALFSRVDRTLTVKFTVMTDTGDILKDEVSINA